MAPSRSLNTGGSRFRPDRDREIVRAWELHRAGEPMRVIAEQLGCSVGTAHTRVREAREALMATGLVDVDAARARSAATLDSWQSQIEAAIQAVEVELLPGIDRLLKIEERRARLLGLDAVHRIRVESTAPEKPEKARVPVALVRELVASEAHDRLHDERGDRDDPTDPTNVCTDDECPLLAKARAEADARWAAESAALAPTGTD